MARDSGSLKCCLAPEKSPDTGPLVAGSVILLLEGGAVGRCPEGRTPESGAGASVIEAVLETQFAVFLLF